MAIESHKKWTLFDQSHKKSYIFWISVFFVWFTLEKISIKTHIVTSFPQKIVASMLFLLKMATNELICLILYWSDKNVDKHNVLDYL